MRSPKWLSIISAAGLLGTVSLHSNEHNSLIYNISLALFGSALLGFIMSFIEYFAVRLNAMEEFSRSIASKHSR